MNLAGQLLEGLLRDGCGWRQQQGFVQRIARAQMLGSRADGTLVRRQADTGERRGTAFHRQLNTVRRIVEGTAEEHIIGHHLTEAPFDATSRLQDVVLDAEQGFRLAGGQQRRAVFQRQADGGAFNHCFTARNDLIAAGWR
ncbi:hypothetical protein D3C75_937710 [compost metagenome]